MCCKNIKITLPKAEENCIALICGKYKTMSELAPGSKAPAFSGTDQDGKTIKLGDFKGKKVALFFYPKDMTPGCTAEACNLRDNHSALSKAGYSVIGVSADSEESHKKFIAKHELPFPLIADTEGTIIKQFGAWGEKSMYGKKYMGILRRTVVIDEAGKIARIIEKVKTADHAAQILNEDQ